MPGWNSGFCQWQQLAIAADSFGRDGAHSARCSGFGARAKCGWGDIQGFGGGGRHNCTNPVRAGGNWSNRVFYRARRPGSVNRSRICTESDSGTRVKSSAGSPVAKRGFAKRLTRAAKYTSWHGPSAVHARHLRLCAGCTNPVHGGRVQPHRQFKQRRQSNAAGATGIPAAVQHAVGIYCLR